VILRQYLHTEPAVGASYLLGCGGKAVDPMGPVAPYLEDAERLGLKLGYVIDTHVHALVLRDIPPRPQGFEEIRAHNLEGG